MSAALNIVGSFLMVLSRIVGNLYTKMWGLFNIPWFDHRFDYLRGPENWYWCERGIFANRIIKPGDTVLDLCCGDGIYSGLFYSTIAGLVHAIDRDTRAISIARGRYSKPNVRFIVSDVVKEPFPRANYDIVTFFEGIEHLSVEAGTRLLQKIAVALLPNDGTLIGSTPIVPSKGGHNPEHDNEFLSTEQLRVFLKSHFGEMEIWVSKWSTRTACYFQCKHPIILSKNEITQVIQTYYQSI